ncbi:AbfB domain-containing protein [Dactylosporangium siamense]|uniref:SGNH hydrolase n=1 Tax=Dactylosporangium siamense TaxID=685454 RepID=A0A919UCG0_9ACTN|nr:AbfB domain-containing protein [Dactylosporangium siamense]GIG46751.1 hypothetical protein Dsi01nite_047920 [Dactylosporangium siamense]
MKRLLVALLLVASLGIAAPAHAETNGGTRIMPLGDSITDGFNVPGGYRINLWQSLAGSGQQVDFVGGQFNGPGDLGDHDHEGHPGWRIDEIAANVSGWVAGTAPRTVLLHIGTNDIIQNFDLAGAPGRLSGLIDRITAAAPGADVFVASITPLADPGREVHVNEYNATIPGIVAGKGSRVHFVDMHAALSVADLADGVHPNRGGYDRMAAVWAAALGAGLTSLRVTTPGFTDRYLRHQNGLAVTSPVISQLDRDDATFRVVPGLAAAGCSSFESRNFPGYFLRHQNGRVRISLNDGSALLRADATWCASSAAGGVRLAAYNFPGSFLRHINSEVWLATPGGPNAWDNPASFVPDTTWALESPWSP